MKRYFSFVLFLILSIMVSCNSIQEADLIVINAKVYTVDESFQTAEAFAVIDGKFVAVGASEKILKKYKSKNIIDLDGKAVYPGFIDPHSHFTGYCENLQKADLMGTESTDQIIEILKEQHSKISSEWLLGRGWDQNDWEVKEFPVKEILDEIFPDVPVYLTRVDGHAAWVNSEALRRAGITAETKVPGGDVILKNGEPTGVLIDNAMGLVYSKIPDPSEDVLKKLLEEGQQKCFAVGLTSVSDAGLGYNTVNLLDNMHKEGKLSMRIYAMLSPSKENLDGFIRKGIYKTDYLNVRSVKLFADGALGSRGACLLEPYSDDSDNLGLIVETEDMLRKWCEIAYENNYQVNTHCIGDSANRLMLNLYAEQLKEQNDRRWRIEHSQVIHPDDFDLFGKYSIVPSIQTTHATSDMYWAGDRLGEERVIGAYAYKKLLNQLGWLPNGSDFPVEYINPLYGFHAAVARQDKKGWPEKGFQMENALSREEALKAMTIWAAKAAFEENEKGSIEVGKFADFVVLEKDIMQVDISETFDAPINSTYVNGVKVY